MPKHALYFSKNCKKLSSLQTSVCPRSLGNMPTIIYNIGRPYLLASFYTFDPLKYFSPQHHYAISNCTQMKLHHFKIQNLSAMTIQRNFVKRNEKYSPAHFCLGTNVCGLGLSFGVKVKAAVKGLRLANKLTLNQSIVSK